MATSWDFLEKSGESGAGWDYDEVNLAYDETFSPDTGGVVYYDSQGSQSSWTFITKH